MDIFASMHSGEVGMPDGVDLSKTVLTRIGKRWLRNASKVLFLSSLSSLDSLGFGCCER